MIRISRRDLIKAGTGGMCALALGAPAVLAARAERNKPRIAFIGLGGRGSKAVLPDCLQHGGKVVALCDVDRRQLEAASRIVTEAGLKPPRLYEDYRKLLDQGAEIDAVVIATPDHWHAPLCTAFIKAGKHVYCEKPLTRTIGEARALRELARSSPVVTQLGNQGSAFATLRRSVELVKAGVLGQVRDAHAWIGSPPMRALAAADIEGEDPAPQGFKWDFWLGPAKPRPYKTKIYHPGSWRRWYDFGSGRLGDFGCHGFNLPMRALDLAHPERVEFDAERAGGNAYPLSARVRLHFARRGELDPMTIHWHDGVYRPDEKIMNELLAVYKKPPFSGCMLLGENGWIYATCWGENAIIKLKDEARPRGVLDHEATRSIEQSLPRTANHMLEWLQACQGQGKTFSDFDTGGRLTELSLAGVLALRLGRAIAWDGDKMAVAGAPEAERLIHEPWRKRWMPQGGAA